MAELDDYVFKKVIMPDPIVDPASHKNWQGNNKKLIGFLKGYVEDGEKSFITSDNAHIVWTALIDHHEKQGPIMQVHIIQELLSITYGKDVSSWFTTSDHICDICTRIFSQTIPTFDVLYMDALEAKNNNIRSKMTAFYISNPTATSQVLMNCIQQEIVYKAHQDVPNPEVTLTADKPAHSVLTYTILFLPLYHFPSTTDTPTMQHACATTCATSASLRDCLLTPLTLTCPVNPLHHWTSFAYGTYR